MSIVFLILKIIGILLLVILCLILLILFHPIFYQIKGEAEEKISLQGYFWWLFQIIRLEVRWMDQEFSFRLRIFGFSKNLGEEETMEEDSAESAMDERASEGETFREEEEKNPKDASIVGERNPVETSAVEEAENPTETSAVEEADRQAVKSAAEENSSQQEKNADKQKKAKTNENGILDRFKEFRQEASDERNRQAISHLWRELCYLLAHLKPKYVKAEIFFSTGDPALTGEVTGALSLFPLIYRYDAHIYPDFLSEEFYIKGSMKMKGHIAVFHFLKILIRLFLDKNIKRLYYKFK